MKYKTIVIDLPWDIGVCAPIQIHSKQLRAKLPYETMSDSELMNFDINRFADENCDLFLWTTKGKIHTALHIIEKWGFHYANLFAWNKRDGINHNGVHHVLEFVIYAYKGKNGLDYSKPMDSYFEAKRIKHSQKPDKFYQLIRERTKEPRIDIFARKRHYGFDAWGDQVESQMEMPILLFTSEKFQTKNGDSK